MKTLQDLLLLHLLTFGYLDNITINNWFQTTQLENRQDDQDDEDMVVNDVEQNIEEAIVITEVDVGLRWDLQWIDNQNVFLFTFLYLCLLSVSTVSLPL